MPKKGDLDFILSKFDENLGIYDSEDWFTKRLLQSKEDTRKKIALKFANWFFWLIGIILIVIPIYNYNVCCTEAHIDLSDLLATMGSMVGGPLGFVIGYYFKSENQ